MRLTTVLWVLAGLAVAAVVLVFVNVYRLGRAHARLAANLVADANTETNRTFDPDDVEGVPDPVRQYFETVLEPGQPHVRSVHLEQRGDFRLGGADAGWKSLEATQHFTVDPPGFVWDATIGVAPFLPARVVDAYDHGEGYLQAKLLSTVTVADVGPNAKMNEGELTRYLAEAVWLPTALLPASGVEWEAIDDRSARATIEHDGNVASVVFHFDEKNLIDRVTARRYRQEDDDEASWRGTFREYEERNGMLIPTDAEVAWELPEGDLPYWRAAITTIDHR